MRVGGEETFLTMNYHLLLNKITPLPTPLEPHDHLDLPTLPLLSESDCRQHLGPWVLLACYSMFHRTLPQRPQGWAADGTRSKRDSTVEKKGRRQESARRLRPREGPGPKAPSAECLPATTPSPSSSARRCSRQSWPWWYTRRTGTPQSARPGTGTCACSAACSGWEVWHWWRSRCTLSEGKSQLLAQGQVPSSSPIGRLSVRWLEEQDGIGKPG